MLVDRPIAARSDHAYGPVLARNPPCNRSPRPNDTRFIPAQLRGRASKLAAAQLVPDQLRGGDGSLLQNPRHLREPDPISRINRNGLPAAKLWLLERLDDGSGAATRRAARQRFQAWLERAAASAPALHPRGNMVDSDVESIPKSIRPVFRPASQGRRGAHAGLHFTPSWGSRHLSLSEPPLEFVGHYNCTGHGTFRPMHRSPIRTIPCTPNGPRFPPAGSPRDLARGEKRPHVAVGTTRRRTLESWLSNGAEQEKPEVKPRLVRRKRSVL